MAHDYRYFPDPDLMPVKIDAPWQDRLRADCPELPFPKQRRFLERYQIPFTLTSVLIWDRGLADYFEETARLCGKPQMAGNWIVNDLLRELGSSGQTLAQSKVRPSHLAALVQLVDSGAVLTNAAKEIFIAMFASGETPGAIAERSGLKAAPADTGELEQWCRDAITASPKALAEFKAGKDSAINAFKGPVMKAAKGKANPKLVDETLRRLLAQM